MRLSYAEMPRSGKKKKKPQTKTNKQKKGCSTSATNRLYQWGQKVYEYTDDMEQMLRRLSMEGSVAAHMAARCQ